MVRRLINAEPEGSPDPDREEGGLGSGGDWEGTIELVEAVTVPPLSARITRFRIVRRDDPKIIDDVKAPRNQAVFLEPVGLPGVYMAPVVATLDNGDASNTRGSDPLVVGNTPLMNNKTPPCESVK